MEGSMDNGQYHTCLQISLCGNRRRLIHAKNMIYCQKSGTAYMSRPTWDGSRRLTEIGSDAYTPTDGRTPFGNTIALCVASRGKSRRTVETRQRYYGLPMHAPLISRKNIVHTHWPRVVLRPRLKGRAQTVFIADVKCMDITAGAIYNSLLHDVVSQLLSVV